MTEWRDVVGYEGLYKVSDDGQVRNMTSGKLLSLCLSVGYPSAGLTKHKKQVRVYIHSLVAAAFIGSRPDGYHINHKDGVKTNNHVSNLEYCTPKENSEHAIRTGLAPEAEGELEKQARNKGMSPEQLLLWLFKHHYTATDAALAAGVSRFTLHKAMSKYSIKSPYKARKAARL